MKGKRPAIPSPIIVPGYDARFTSLMMRAWGQEPAKRPTMSGTVALVPNHCHCSHMWCAVYVVIVIVRDLENMLVSISRAVFPQIPVVLDEALLPSPPSLQDSCRLSKPMLPNNLARCVNTVQMDPAWSLIDHSIIGDVNPRMAPTWAVFSRQAPHWLLKPSLDWTADFQLSPSDMYICGKNICVYLCVVGGLVWMCMFHQSTLWLAVVVVFNCRCGLCEVCQ